LGKKFTIPKTSGFGEAMRSQIFFKTLLAAKKDPFSPKRKGIGFVFGDVAFADRVLDQLFILFCRMDRSLPGRRNDPFHQEIDDDQQAE
jgi:hypothetical protein